MIKRILAATARTAHVALRSVGASHATGTATVVYDGAHGATVTLTARGLTAGTHAAHIHIGHCGKNGDVKYPLAPVTASAAGVGTSVTTFPYKLAGAALYINIHGVPGKPMLIVSCGNLP